MDIATIVMFVFFAAILYGAVRYHTKNKDD